MRTIQRFVCVLFLASLALAANPQDTAKSVAPPATAYPNVLLMTLDTTRADRMGFLGSKRGLTPNLDALAKDSTVFTHDYSQAPLTPTSHASILTGTYPQYHQVLTFPIPLGKDIPYLPSILKAHGYTTGAIVASLALAPSYGAPGFDRGFDSYDGKMSWNGYTPATRYQTVERRADEIVDKAIAWLKNRPPGPFFLWVHFFDPHDPYDPPPPFKERYAKAPYDGEIAYMDSAIARLMAELKKDGLYDGLAIAVTADHGESLGAHGEDQHGIFVYDETIHVPLLIKLPHEQSAGKRVDSIVESVDIVPTLLHNAGIEVPSQVQGSSLLELMKPGAEGDAAAAAWRDRGAFSESEYAHLTFAWSDEKSFRTGKYLFIQAPRPELYDQQTDPRELHNLATTTPAVADTLSTHIKDFVQKTTNTGATPKSQMDDAAAKKLAALGYMTARSEESLAASTEKGADPKDKIGIINTINRINTILQDFRCDKAMPALKKAVVEDPNISMLHFFLGGCYMESKAYDKAAPELRKAAELDPGFTKAHFNLARVLVQAHKFKEATAEFETVATLEPHIIETHIYLMQLYSKQNRPQDTIREARRVLKDSPDSFWANLDLGTALVKTGDPQGAVPPLEKAASLRPDRPGPHIVLAEAYKRIGLETNAMQERAEAERLGAVYKATPDAEPGEDETDPK
ncbi:MAG: sulfatase-like hydrolase/transferase [Terriglobales bacterium]